MEGLIAVILLVAIVPIILLVNSGRESKIEERVRTMGGRLQSSERRSIFTGLGPFHVVGKGRSVYRYTYEKDGSQHEGWVRFGGLMGPDWKM